MSFSSYKPKQVAFGSYGVKRDRLVNLINSSQQDVPGPGSYPQMPERASSLSNATSESKFKNSTTRPYH